MRGFINTFVLVILLVGIALGGYLVQQKTNFLSKAFFIPNLSPDTVIANPAIPQPTVPYGVSNNPFISIFARLSLQKTLPTNPTSTPINPYSASSSGSQTPSDTNPFQAEPTPTNAPAPTPTNMPSITSVWPTYAHYGEVVHMNGQNFYPIGVDPANLKVYLQQDYGTRILLASLSPNVGNPTWTNTDISFTVYPQDKITGTLIVAVGDNSVSYTSTFIMAP